MGKNYFCECKCIIKPNLAKMKISDIMENYISASRVFLFFAVFWGILMVFLTPAFMVPDEPNHFYRAYQISELKFIPEVNNNRLGGTLPHSLLDLQLKIWETNGINLKMDKNLFNECLGISLKPKEKSFILFPNTSLYSPVSYMPQAIGISIGRIFEAPPLVLVYLGRIFNLAFWISIIYFSLKIIPIYKWLFLMLALLPMSISQSASLSADVVVNGLSFLLIAFIFNLAFDLKANLGNREFVILLAIVVLLTLSKSIYFFLGLLYFIIPVKKAKTTKSYFIKSFVLIISTVITLVLSSVIINNLTNQINPIEIFYGNVPGSPQINPGKQIQFIISDIGGFVKMVIKSFIWYRDMAYKSFIGILGWMNVLLYLKYYPFAVFILALTALLESKKTITINLFQRLIMLISFVGVIFLFSFTMYLSWTEVGGEMVTNLQGRYFIPIVPLLLVPFYNKKITVKPIVFPITSIIFIAISIAATVQAITEFYYC